MMKFTLTYDGPLPASANKPKNKEKWEIRKQIHPQLVDLWSSHPTLIGVAQASFFPLDGGILIQGHHAHPGRLKLPFLSRPIEEDDPPRGSINLTEPIHKHGRSFLPLVRESFALHCGLKVLFLRAEPPGRLYQGGDIDGRIKTLLDALAMPQHVEQIINDPSAPVPIYCLMEDDSMVSGLQIETERLLSSQNHPKDHVRLIIEVDVRVREARIYNQPFLG